jgi:PST family polysaccharide transporter
MVIGFMVGLPYGPRGVAIAYTMVMIMLTIPAILYAASPIGFRFSEVFAVIWKYSCASILAGLLIAYIRKLFIFESGIFLRIALLSFTYVFIYLALVTIIYWDTKPIIEMFNLFKNILKKFYPTKNKA